MIPRYSFDFSDKEYQILLLALDLCHRARIGGSEEEHLRRLLIKAKNPPPSLADEVEELQDEITDLKNQNTDLSDDVESHLARIKELENGDR